MLEVAEGIQYLHSEGIVHGNLHGVSLVLSCILNLQSAHQIVCKGNVLLDPTFHCQITDFGSTRHAEATVIQSTTAFCMNSAAPELFSICIKCGQLDCDEHDDGDEESHKSKTKETDIYAFGCLYYAVCFRFSSTYSVD
jgi:serine/threonine protein kinase